MSDQLKWLLLIGGSVLLLVIITLAIIVFSKKAKRKKIMEFPGLLEALGGTENISNITLNGSRVSLNFESKKNIDKELVKENGVETIVVSNKKITLVIGKKASAVYKYLSSIEKA